MRQSDLFNSTVASSVTLNLRGINIPSFKNNKMVITKSPNGRLLDRPLLITKPEFQKVMAAIMDSFESELCSAFQREGAQTLAASSIQSWIAWCVPADDCWEMIPEIQVSGELCEPGQEGATITIERL